MLWSTTDDDKFCGVNLLWVCTEILVAPTHILKETRGNPTTVFSLSPPVQPLLGRMSIGTVSVWFWVAHLGSELYPNVLVLFQRHSCKYYRRIFSMHFITVSETSLTYFSHTILTLFLHLWFSIYLLSLSSMFFQRAYTFLHLFPILCICIFYF